MLSNVTETTWGRGLAVGGHEAGVGKHPRHHENGANDEHGSASPAVHEEQSGDGHENVDDVLDRAGDEVDVSPESSHAKHVSDVVLKQKVSYGL